LRASRMMSGARWFINAVGFGGGFCAQRRRVARGEGVRNAMVVRSVHEKEKTEFWLTPLKSPRSKSTPNWKHIILASPDWPDNLVVPQKNSLPEESEAIQDSMSTNDSWEWELWRHPEGHCYYLKVWPMGKGDFGNIKTPAAQLTVMEAFHFLLSTEE